MSAKANAIVDTNVIIRYLVRDLPELCVELDPWFEAVRSGKQKVLLFESVLIECVYVLTKYYQVPKDETAAALHGLLSYRGMLHEEKETLVAALTLLAETALDPVDCLVLAKAQRDGLQIKTFDKALLKLATPGVLTP